MAHLLGSKAFTGSGVRSAARAPSSRVPVAARPVGRARHANRKAVEVKAIFNLFAPKAAAQPTSAKAAELVEDLLELVASRPSPQAVEKLVSELQPLGIKAPVRSKSLFGEYKLLYSSKGGSAASAPKQILEEPDQIREVTQVKTLGLLPGSSTLSGTINGLSGDTYEEVFDQLDVKAAIGGQSRAVDQTRTVQVLYLDGQLRITRTTTEGNNGPAVLNVYQRVEDEADAEEEEEEEPPRKKQGTGMVFFGSGPKEGTATIAEREVRKKMAEQAARAGSPRLPANLPSSPAAVAAAAKRNGTVQLAAAKQASPKPGTQQVAVRNPAAEARAAAEAKRKADAEAKAKEEQVKAKARDAASAKDKAESDRRAAAERQAAIKAQLEELSADLKEAQADARDAAKEVKDQERANAVVLKQVAGARQQLRSAAQDIENLVEESDKAAAARSAAEAALRQALSELSGAQAKLKAAGTQVTAGARK